MSIKTKIAIALAAVAILVFSVVGYASRRGQIALIELAKQRELDTYANTFQASFQRAANHALGSAELVAQLAITKRIMRAGIDAANSQTTPEKKKEAATPYHDQLLQEFGPSYEVQHAKYGAVQGHFHRPPAFSFARLHESDTTKWNDDLSAHRHAIVEASSKGVALSGLEIGRAGLGIRGIAPVKDSKGLIGVFEVGLGLKPVIDEVKQTTGAELGVFLDKAVQEATTWQTFTATGRDFGPYKHIQATDTATVERVVEEAVLATAAEKRVETRSVDGIEYGVVYLPLRDYSGKRVGAIVITRDFSKYVELSGVATRNSVILFAIALVLLIVVAMLTLGRLVIAPLATITRAADAISTGEMDARFAMDRRDEIGALSKSFERMRTSLEKAMKALETR